jgi:FkbM family methyltransferase
VNLSSPPARVARAVVNRLAGDEIRVVHVLGGVARGRRLALDLSVEKAYWLGHYEREVQRFLRDTVRQGDLFFDLGAHVGFFSVCAAVLGARVVAVEADAANASRLQRNAELNRVAADVVHAAVWSAEGEVQLLPGGSAKEFRAVPGRGVQSVTVDALAREHGAPTLVKLDVEGAEVDALRGAARVLSEDRPVIVCEVHGDRRDAVVALLDGYRIDELGGRDRLVARPIQSAR